MFIPNTRCTIRRRSAVNVYGKATYESPKPGLCAIVRLEQESNSTSVRADSSASRGSAKEEIIQARLLFPARTQLSKGDIVQVMHYVMVVQSVWPRHNVTGRLDHWQLDLRIMTSNELSAVA